MRILVIDDTFDARLAIADVLRDTPHAVEGAYDPEVLPRLLGEAPPFDVALVDMVFAGCARSGLGALRMLREHSPDIKTVIRCSDDEANRQLHLVAAFTLFAPVALMSRSENPRALVPLLDAVERGEQVASGAGRYRHSGPPPTLLDELIGNKTDLAIWQALIRFDRRPDIARAAYISPATVDHFIGDMYQVVGKFQLRFRLGEPAAAPEPGKERGHNAPLVQLAFFARLFRDFFRDPDLGPLLEQRWAARRRNLSQPSVAVRQARPHGRRRA